MSSSNKSKKNRKSKKHRKKHRHSNFYSSENDSSDIYSDEEMLMIDYDKKHKSKTGANNDYQDNDSSDDHSGTFDFDDVGDNENEIPDEERETHFSLTRGQKATQVIEILLILLSVACSIAALVYCPIVFVRVNDTKNEIQTFEDAYNITDDTILEDQCGTIDMITGNITVDTQMNLNSDYINVTHFSKGDLTKIGRFRLGFTKNSEEERSQNAMAGATVLEKFDYNSAPSIGFHLDDMDDVQNRCNRDTGVIGAGNNWVYTLIDTKKTGEALVYLCFCVNVDDIFKDTYTGPGVNNDRCLNAGSERPDTYDAKFQERCIAQQFCYNWFSDNYRDTGGGTVSDYNICSYIPK